MGTETWYAEGLAVGRLEALDEVRRRVGELQRDYEAERPGPYITGFLTAIDITLTIIAAVKSADV